MGKRLWFSKNVYESFIREGKATLARYAKDQQIALQGETCSTLDIILEGAVAIHNLDEEGRLFKAQVLTKGDSCGTTLLFGSNNTYPMQVVAQTEATILHLKRELVLELCEQRRDVLVALVSIISDRAHMLGTTINRISTLSLRESLLSYLHKLAQEQQSNQITLPITKKELAERMGFARTSVSRELAKLREEGLLSVNGRVVTLHSVPHLRPSRGA